MQGLGAYVVASMVTELVISRVFFVWQHNVIGRCLKWNSRVSNRGFGPVE